MRLGFQSSLNIVGMSIRHISSSFFGSKLNVCIFVEF